MLPDFSKTIDDVREARRRFDSMSAGDRAQLRRTKDVEDLLMEGAYWRLVGNLHRPGLPNVVLLFGEAPHRIFKMGFSFGRFLKQHLPSNEESQSLRFRRIIESEREDLPHRMRGLLRLASKREKPVDWGALGADIIFFGDAVKRRWTQDFFAPIQIVGKPQVTEQE